MYPQQSCSRSFICTHYMICLAHIMQMHLLSYDTCHLNGILGRIFTYMDNLPSAAKLWQIRPFICELRACPTNLILQCAKFDESSPLFHLIMRTNRRCAAHQAPMLRQSKNQDCSDTYGIAVYSAGEVQLFLTKRKKHSCISKIQEC